MDALDEAPFGYFVLDHDWRYVYNNAAVASLVFRNVDELVGKVVWDWWDSCRSHSRLGSCRH